MRLGVLLAAQQLRMSILAAASKLPALLGDKRPPVLLKAGISQQRHSTKIRTKNGPCPICKSTLNKNGLCHNRSCWNCVDPVTAKPARPRLPFRAGGKEIQITRKVWDRGRRHLTDAELHAVLRNHLRDEASSWAPVLVSVFKRTPEVRRILEKVWAHA